MAQQNHQFSVRLVAAIKRSGMTRKKIAQEIGIRVESMTKYCRHGGVPEWDILVKMAGKLGVSCDWLLMGDDAATTPGPQIPAPVPAGIQKSDDLATFKANLQTLISEKCDGKHTRLARLADVAPSTLQSWIDKETVNPNAFAVLKIAKACGVTVEWLLTGYDRAIEQDPQQSLFKNQEARARAESTLALARRILATDSRSARIIEEIIEDYGEKLFGLPEGDKKTA